MADFLRAGTVAQQQHAQQQRLQGFSQQMQQHQNPNPGATPNHPGGNPNPSTQVFSNIAGLPTTPASAAQFQMMADRNPMLRAALQQQQQHQRQSQQQQSHPAGANSPFDPANLGINMSAQNPGQAPTHAMAPGNTNLMPGANAAELSRQYRLMSRAGQNQGQNANTLNTLNQAASIMNRSQQSVQPPQTSPFQQQIPNGGNMQMGPHVGPQAHQNPNPQQHLNRQMFQSIPSQFSSSIGPNIPNTPIGSGGHPQQPQQLPNQQSPQQGQALRLPDRQRIDTNLLMLQGQIQQLDGKLRTLGYAPLNPGPPKSLTEEQRGLLKELHGKKTGYMKLLGIRQQLDRMPQSSGPGPSGMGGQGGGEGGMNVSQNGYASCASLTSPYY